MNYKYVIALSIAVGALPAAASATDYVNDPLTDPGSPGLGVRGGGFSPSGWTTANADDTLWFVVDDALESGTMSFDVTGIGLCQSGCLGDMDIFTLYQQPDGVAQPINYAPYYRNNDMRVFIRMFNVPNDPINGAMKMELAGCAVGSPYYDNTCPSSCSALDGIAYCNGQMNDCGWDATHTYHFELDWGGGTMTYFRDGVALGSVTYPSTFAPQPLVVQLGSPRNGQAGGSGMMPGITFANLHVGGTAGTQTPACNAPVVTPPPDAGPPVIAPCTDGSIGDIADATAASWNNNSVDPYPGDLNVEGDGTNPTAMVYLMFPPPGGYVAQATLTVHTLADSHAAGGSGQVCVVSSDAWDESTLTWIGAPPVTSQCVGPARAVQPDQEVSWDVTPLLGSSGNVSLALVSTDSDGAHFYSKESGGCALGPRLQLVLGTPPSIDAGSPEVPDAGPVVDIPDAGSVVTPPQDAGSPPAVDAGSSANPPSDAGSVQPATGAGSAPSKPGAAGDSRVTSSCESAGPGPLAWTALLALALIVRGRMRH